MLRMSVAGERSEADKAKPVVKDAGAVVLGSLGIGVTVADAVKVAGSRAVADQVVLEPAAGDDVLEVTLEGGVRLYLPAEQAPELLAAPPGRAAVVPGTIPLASSLAVGDGSRGVGDWAIEGLRLIGVDLAGRTAAAVAAGIDAHQVPKPGLYRWRGQALAPVEERLPEGTEPWLLFLHGTFSNTLGSFGALAAQSAQWRRLEAAYRDRILALDHHTLSRSPIENAEEVLARLPEGAELHLVGYSRGGLIGELLCRGRLEGRALPFDETELGLFAGADRIEQRAALERLGTSLIALRPGIERYVRVACPARGTTLASDRLDRWLNFVLNAVGLGIGAVASPLAGEIYDLVTAFLLAVIKERADASTIPGLEAMIPGAPLVRLLNRPGVTAATDLAVLEGDIEGAGILGRLKVLATDLFFREDHDLVVNTSAMDGGMARNPPARASFTQGPEVSHFAYFSNPRTAERVVEGLLRADDQDGGFKPIPAEEVGVVTAPAKRGGEKRPVVFVLPGITGTVLGCIDKGRERRIWVDLPQLAFGGLRRLAIDQPDIIAKEPLSLYYGELCGFLGGTHDVRPWGYDWRRSILDNAKAFATVLGNALAATDQPVRIVAHSMGGLVARSAFLDAKLWQRFQERAGSRLIQLGTPNGGSWSIPYMLMGRDTLMGYLATLDFTMSRREQQQVVVRFPGALQMLPHAETPLFDPARWAALAQLDPGDEDWAAPRADDLAIAARFRDAFAKAPCDPERLLYVAGHAPTMVGIEEDPAAPAGQRIRFRTTTEGDGQVPWSTGIPPGIRAWYTDAVHGDLARHEPAFPAILDLLETGTTRRLPTTPPAAARGRGVPAAKVRDTVPMFPDAEDLLLAGMGGSTQARAAGRGHPDQDQGGPRPSGVRQASGAWSATMPATRSTVRSGSSTRRWVAGWPSGKQLGLYPGALGTNTVALDRRTRPSGAIVVGLGDHAELAPGTLSETLAARAAGLCGRGRRRPARARARGEGAAARCHRAAGRLRRRRPADPELRRGAAARGAGGPAARSATTALSELESAGTGGGPRHPGLARARPRAAGHRVPRAGSSSTGGQGHAAGGRRNVGGDDDPTWWQPIQITMEEVGGERVMRYVTTAGRARAEASLVPGNTGFVERFVAQATAQRRAGRPSRCGRARAVRAALARADQGDQPRGPQPAPGRRRERRPSRGSCWTTGGHGPDTPASAGGERPSPPAVRARPRPPARADASSARRWHVRRAAAGPGGGRSARRAEAGLRAAARCRGGGAARSPSGSSAAGYDGDAADRRRGRRRAGGRGAVRAGLDHRPHRGPRRGRLRAFARGRQAAQGDRHRARRRAVPRPGDPRPAGRACPLLVFVNCCHVGQRRSGSRGRARGPARRRPEPRRQRRRAAGPHGRARRRRRRLGGRRQQRVAGSPDDFYDAMLGGQDVRRCRARTRGRLIYREGGQDTTWGAYQCYGEPDWRLVGDGGRGEADQRRAWFASVGEAVAAAEQIREAAQVGLDRDHAACAASSTRAEPGPPAQSISRKARAAGGPGRGLWRARLRSRRRCGTTRRRAPPSAPWCLLRALEQLANLKVRLAVRELGANPEAAEIDRAARRDPRRHCGHRSGGRARRHVGRALRAAGRLPQAAGIDSARRHARGRAQGQDGAYTAADRQAEQSGRPAYYPRLMASRSARRHQQAGGRLSAAARKHLLEVGTGIGGGAAGTGDLWAELALGDARCCARSPTVGSRRRRSAS